MNFEERILRLTEKHEALPQTAEMIALQMAENARRAEQRDKEWHARNLIIDERFLNTDVRINRVLDLIEFQDSRILKLEAADREGES